MPPSTSVRTPLPCVEGTRFNFSVSVVEFASVLTAISLVPAAGTTSMPVTGTPFPPIDATSVISALVGLMPVLLLVNIWSSVSAEPSPACEDNTGASPWLASSIGVCRFSPPSVSVEGVVVSGLVGGAGAGVAMGLGAILISGTAALGITTIGSSYIIIEKTLPYVSECINVFVRFVSKPNTYMAKIH